MKKECLIFALIILILMISSVSLASAGWFDDIWNTLTGRVVGNETETCTDSDGGLDYYVKGEVTVTDSEGGSEVFSDECVMRQAGYTVIEQYCSGDTAASEDYLCPDHEFCEDGICVEPTCEDSEGEVDYYNKGYITTTLPSQGTKWDVCNPNEGFENYVQDWYCMSGRGWINNYNCPNGCSDGACNPDSGEQCNSSNLELCTNYQLCDNAGGYWYNSICNLQPQTITNETITNETSGTTTTTTTPDEDETTTTQPTIPADLTNATSGLTPEQITAIEEAIGEQTTEVTEAIVSENGTVSCSQGCLHENACFPISIRKKVNGVNSYCNIGLSEENNVVYVWDQQREEDVFCDNHYECRSNFCIDDKCVKQGLITVIINWFKRLFGVTTLGEDSGETNQTANQTY